MSDVMNPYQKDEEENPIARNTNQYTQSAAQSSTPPAYRKEYTVKKPLVLPKTYTTKAPAQGAGQLSGNAGQTPTENGTNTRPAENAQPAGDYWGTVDSRAQGLAQIREKNAEHYEAVLPDFEYEALNNHFVDVAKTDGLKAAEEERYRYMNALQYSRLYDIPFETALEHLDEYNTALFGEDTQNVKSWKGKLERLGDAWTQGVNTIKRSRLGKDLLNAELTGDEETAQAAWQAIAALDKENELLSVSQPQALGMTILTAGLQSTPYTLYAGIPGFLGGMITGGIGVAAGFAAGYDLMRADSYINLRQAGADQKTAYAVSAASGALQAAVEQSLGVIAHGAATGAKIAGKQILNPLTKGAERTLADKITKLAFSHFKIEGTAARMATSFALNHIGDVFEEGAEEFWQETIDGISYHVAKAFSENEVEADDLEKIVRDSVEAFKGGVAGALFLGVFDAGFSAKANIRDFKDLKEAAETIPSREAFKKVTKENLAFEGMSDEKRIAAQNAIYDSFENVRESADEKEIENIRVTKDIAEGVETVKADEETGEEIATGEAVRDESGKLYVQEDKNVSGNIKRLLFGDPTREGTADDGNRYGYIEYTENGDKVNIEKFVMAGQRENIRQEAWEMFAERVAGKDIEWNTRLEEDAKIKQAIIDANPSGKSAGLNYYGAETKTDAAERVKLVHQMKELFPKIKREQYPAAIVALEALARHQKGSLTEWVQSQFHNGKVFTNQYLTENFAEAAQTAQAQGATVYGAAQFTKDLKAAIYVSEHADFDTFLHELLHFAEHNLTDEERTRMETLMRDLMQKTGKEWKGWDTDAQELFADTGVDVFRTGKAPKGYEDIFRKIAEFIRDIFRGFQRIAQGYINDDIVKAYHELLDMDNSLLRKAEEAVAQADKERKEAQLEKEAKAWREEKQKEAASKTPQQTTAEHVSAKADEIAQSVTADPVATDGEKAGAVLDAAGIARVGEEISQGFKDLVTGNFAGESIPADMFFQAERAENAESLRQMEAVRKQYEGTESWMKAPNGKPTNLTEKQWLQVRTPNFKRWFGNWEAKSIAERIQNYIETADAVAKIDGSQFQKDDTPLTDKVEEYYKKKYNGEVERKEIGIVKIDRRSVKDSVAHGIGKEKAAAFALAPEVIQHGMIVDYQTNWKGRGYDTFVIAAPIEIGGKAYICETVITDSEKRTGFYLHEVELKEKVQDVFKTAINGTPQTSRLIISRLVTDVNENNVSKVVDENGEPLVVYHATSENFDIFKGDVFHFGTKAQADLRTNDFKNYLDDDIRSFKEKIKNAKTQTDFANWSNALEELEAKRKRFENPNLLGVFLNARNIKREYDEGGSWGEKATQAKNAGYDGFVYYNNYENDGNDSYAVFSPNQIKSATDNTGAFDPHNPSILFQIAGEIGAARLDAADEETREGKSRMGNLAVAKSMEAAGKDAQAIRLATGWEKGADGLWRYEIDDSFKFDDFQSFYENTKEEGKLTDYINENSEIFKAYPELKEITVLQDYYSGSFGGDLGAYNHDKKTISLIGASLENVIDAKSTLLHEIQHAIQHIEGFATGGSPDQFNTVTKETLRKKKVDKLLAEAQAIFNKQSEDWKTKVRAFNRAQIADDLEEMRRISDELDAEAEKTKGTVFDDDFNDYVDLLAQAKDYNSGSRDYEFKELTPGEQYLSLAGETEARNVQRRMDMTAAERARTLLALTEDVAREDQIEMRSAQGALFQTAYHGSGASFDRFNTEEYGLSGEGSMSFGWGTYLSGSENIARDYAERQRKKFEKDAENPFERSSLEHEMFEDLRSFNFDKEAYKAYLLKESENIKNDGDNPYHDFKAMDKLALLDNINRTSLYTVDIPDGKYLVWDKTTPKALRTKIKNALFNFLIQGDYAGSEKYLKPELDDVFDVPLSGQETYNNLQAYLGSDRGTSLFLRDNGIVGMDYPAGTNFGNGDGARNYVIFDDKDIEIKKHVLFQTESAPGGDGSFADFDADIIADAATYDSWEEWRDFVETMYSENVTPEMDDAWYKNVWEGARKAQEEELKKVADDIVEDEESPQEVSADAAEKSDIVPDNGTVSEEEAHPIDSPAKEPKKTKKQKKAEADAQEAEEAQKDAAFIDFIQREGELDKFLSVLNMDWLKLPETPGDMEEALEADRLLKLRAKANVELKHGSWGTAALKAGHVQYGENVGLSQKHRKTLLTLMKKAPRDYRNVYAAYMKNPDWIVPEKYTTAAKLAYRINSPVEEMEALTPEERREFAKRLDFEDLKKEVYDGTFEMDFENIEKLVDGYETDIKALEGKIEKLKDAYTEDERLLVKNNAEIEKLQGELKSKKESLSQAEAVRDIKIRLIKSVNRRVDFRRIMYDQGRKIIAIQALFQPLLKKYVNQFINMEGAYIRDAYSRYKTDYAYRSRIKALAENFPGRSARDLRKVLELFDTKSFEKWTSEEKLFVAEHLPKTDWVKELNLEAIEAARAGSLQLDLQSEETQELLREILPPELLAELSRKELRKWTLEQMEELTGIVDKLYTEGREKLRAKREADRARADKLRKQIEKALKSSGIVIHDDDTPEEKERKQKLIDDFKEKKLPKILATEGVKGTLSEAKRGLVATANRVLHGYDALNIRRIARMLDNGKEGVNTSLLYYREDECFNKKRRAIEAQQKAFDALIKEQGIELSDLYKTVDIEFSNTVTGVDDNGKAFETVLEEKPKKIKLTVDELLYAYAAKDNERSYAAVAGGNLFDEIIRARFREAGQEDRFEKLAKMRMEKVLDATKEILHDPEGGKKYQALLSFIQRAYDEQGKRLNQTAIDVYNAPMWIEEHYVPLQRLEANGDVNEATLKNELLASVAGTGSAGSWIARGNMKSRIDISYVNQKPVRMGLVSTWTESVESTEHIIAYGELNRDLNRIYRGRDAGSMKQYMENRYGKDMVHYIDQYLKEVANPNMYNNPRTALDRVVRVMRGKTAPAYLAWKMSGIVKQFCTSPWPYLQYMSPMRYAKACMECMHKDTQDAIKAKSAFMNSRVYDPLIDLINEQKSRSENKVTHALNSFEKLGMQGLEWVDWACVAPGWLAVYQDEYARLKSDEEQNKLVEKRRKELKSYEDTNGADWVETEAQKARLSESEIERLAVRKADDIVRMTQPSSRNTDIAPLFKGTNEVAKALLQFTTSLNVIWQNLRADLPVAIREREMKQVVGCIAGYMLAGAMVGFVSAGFDDDDDDAEKKAMRILYWNMTQFTDSVPVLGSMATSTAEGLVTGKWQYGSSTLFPVPEKAMNTVRSLSKGDFEKALINFGQVVGLTTGLPVSGAKEALYVAGLGDGKDGLDFHPTALAGRRPKE